MKTGILTRAADSKEKTEIADIKEEIQRKILEEQVANQGDLTETALETILTSKGRLSDETDILDRTLKTTDGNYEIAVRDIWNGTLSSSTPNQPAGRPLSEVQVGDYIKYGEKLTAKTYPTDTNETGYSTSQNFATDTSMLWRVMNKKENEDVEIVAVSDVLASDGNKLYLYGEKGFLNAETVLKNLCDELYTSSYGEGRSISVGDINSLTGYTPAATTSYTYIAGKFWDKASNTFKTATTENPVTVENDVYYYTVETTTPLYDTLIKGTSSYNYWLGSRCAYAGAYAGEGGANFDVRAVDSGKVGVRSLVCAETGGNFNESKPSCGVRPVVTLNSNIQIEEATATEGVATWTIK